MARVAVFAPAPDASRWIAEELDGLACEIEMLSEVSRLLALLGGHHDEPPEILVLDVDALTPSQAREARTFGLRHWAGHVIGIGQVPADLESALAMVAVIERPLGSEALRKLVSTSLRDCTTAEHSWHRQD